MTTHHRFLLRTVHKNIGFLVEHLRAAAEGDNAAVRHYLHGELVALIWLASSLKDGRGDWIVAGAEARGILRKITDRKNKKED